MKKFSLISFIAISILAINGCKKSYFDLSANPNSSSTATPALVLTNAMATTGTFPIVQFQFVSGWMGYWAPSGSYAINNQDVASYSQTTAFGDGLFRSVYDNLGDYEFIEREATKTNSSFYIAAAKVMKAYDYQILVDVFNNVPYTEALKGTANLTPKYDNGQFIYEDLAKQLDAAVVLFKRTDAIGTAASDIMFKGNNSQWIKFANTLKLRLLIHQTQMPGRSAYIQTEIDKITANGGGYLTTDAGVDPGYSASTGKQNPFYAINYNTNNVNIGDYWKANKYAIDFGLATNDTNRLKRLYTKVGDTIFVGSRLGAINNPVGGKVSNLGPGVLKSVSQPSILISASESYFLQAEASLRSFIGGNTGALYAAGVTASFNYLGAVITSIPTSTPADAAAAYLLNVPFGAVPNFTTQLALIIRQKWVSENSVMPLEAYNDYRRLMLPSDIPISVSTFVDVPSIPTRYLYPTSEYSTNAANVAAQGTINHHTSKIFWMP